MFVETITVARDEWEGWNERLRLHADPPAGLVASIAWDSADGNVTSLNVWDTPEAVADFYVARVGAVVESEGMPANTPQRHGEPIAVYLRR
jgi:hypothetical protein